MNLKKTQIIQQSKISSNYVLSFENFIYVYNETWSYTSPTSPLNSYSSPTHFLTSHNRIFKTEKNKKYKIGYWQLSM